MKLRYILFFILLSEARKPNRGKGNSRGKHRNNGKTYPKSCHDIYVQARKNCENLPASGFHTIRVKIKFCKLSYKKKYLIVARKMARAEIGRMYFPARKGLDCYSGKDLNDMTNLTPIWRFFKNGKLIHISYICI